MLSTGRAGSGTFAHLFQNSNMCNAYHCPKPEFIKEAFKVQQDLNKPEEFINDKIKSINELNKGKENKIYVETNNKLYPFALELDKVFDSKFFWVIRDPIKYVNSGISRKWYSGSGGIWDQYRERPKEGWCSGFNQVEKITWQWCEINSIIENSFIKLKNARVYYFEDLINNFDEVLDLVNWIGAHDIKKDTIKRVFELNINVGKYSAPRDPKTGDHIFGQKNLNKTFTNEFNISSIKRIIKENWVSPFSKKYLS